MLKPWHDAGHECYALDIQHKQGLHRTADGITRIGADLLDYRRGIDVVPMPLEMFDFVFCFPPCDNMAVSGARWFKSKGLPALIVALELVEACRDMCERSGSPWMIENPVSTLSTYWRKPDAIVNPFEYGGHVGGADDGYTKKTCLWIGGGFVLPEKRPIPICPKTGKRIHDAGPGPNRANFRSLTPAGFARAVWLANDPQSRAIPQQQPAPTPQPEKYTETSGGRSWARGIVFG